MSFFDNFSYFMENVNPNELGDDLLGLELYNDLCRLKENYEWKDKIENIQRELDYLRESGAINIKDINIEDLRSESLIKAIREYFEEED